MRWRAIVAVLTAALLLRVVSAAAAEVGVTVKNGGGKPVRNAVVYLLPESGKVPPAKAGATGSMDQINKEFVPHVLAVRTGAKVMFPNSDNIFHHVYSFSKAKQFELPLYKGRPQSPVVFDKPGVVALGCNIHDWMKGYIYVLDTPWFAVTGEKGAGKMKDVPPGDYEAFAWYPGAGDGAAIGPKKIKVDEKGGEILEFSVNVKGEKRKNRAPAPSGIMQY